MNGGFVLTMATIRENEWITKQIAKKVIRKYFGCKRFYTNHSLRNNKVSFCQRRDKGIHTSFRMQFNKSNPFRITARPNHR